MEQELNFKQRKRLQRQQKAQSLLVDAVSYQQSQAYKSGFKDLNDSTFKSNTSDLSDGEKTPTTPKITLPKRQLSQNRNSILSVSPAYKQRSKSAKSTGIDSPTTENNLKKSFTFDNTRNISPEIDTKADTIKILLLGDTNTGKTAIILRYCNELKLTKISPTKETHLQKTEEKLFGNSNYNNNNNEKRSALDLHIETSKAFKYSQMLESSDRGSLAHKSASSSFKRLQHRKEKAYSLSDYEKAQDAKELPEEDDEDNFSNYEITTGSTIGIDIKTQLINLDNRFFKIILWDTAGQERFRQALNPLMYKKTQGLILVYDISSLKSFESLWNYWILEWLKNNKFQNGYEKNSKKKGRIYLMGNKTDLYKEREVTHEHVLKFMFKLESEYGHLLSIGGNFEVSCKISGKNNNGGVELAFERIIQDLVSRGCYDNILSDYPSDNEDENSEANTTFEIKDDDDYSPAVDLTKPNNNNNNINKNENLESCCF